MIVKCAWCGEPMQGYDDGESHVICQACYQDLDSIIDCGQEVPEQEAATVLSPLPAVSVEEQAEIETEKDPLIGPRTIVVAGVLAWAVLMVALCMAVRYGS